MANLKLNDQFGLDLDLQPAPASAWVRYFQDLRSVLVNQDLSQLTGLTLDNPAIRSLKTGLTFQDSPVQAEIAATLAVFVPTAQNQALFQPDDYGDNIAVAPAERYVSLQLVASAGASFQQKAGNLGFGVNPGASLAIANYRRFPAAPTLASAAGETIASFTIPRDAGDLKALADQTVVTLTGTGTLGFSATANLLSAVNPLAAVALPAPLPALQVKAGESVTVGAKYQLTGEYQIRVEKTRNRVRLGWHRKRGAEFTVTATAAAGISADFGGMELFSTLLSAISTNPQADAQDLQALDPAQRLAIQGAVTAAVQRKLELAMTFELGRLDQDDAAFLYEIDLDALDASGARAVQQALAADLSALVENEQALAPGITMVRSIFSNLRQAKHSFKVNLLGIYNYASVSQLALKGRVVYEPSSGELVITDTATATRIETAAVNFGADADKLRKVLAQSFLITAAYKGGKCLVSGPQLACSQSHFELHDETSQETLRNDLEVAGALNLIGDSERQALVESARDFGRTVFDAETSYDDALATALFLKDGRPRDVEEYESIGRKAMADMVLHEDHRLFAVTSDAKWAEMRERGQKFAPLFPQFNQVQVAAIETDYLVISWWAETMHETAARLARFTDLDPASDRFQSARKDLADHLADVARKTKDEFGKPWGLVAMFLASDGQARAKTRITGPKLAREWVSAAAIRATQTS